MASSDHTADSGTINLPTSARAALLLAGILSSFAQTGIGPVLPAIAEHFKDVPQAGFISRLLIGIIGIMIMLGSPFVGALADKVGRRRVLLAGFLLYGTFGSVGFFLDNLYLLLASRIIVGFAVSAVGAVMLAIVVTHTGGAARNRWLGYANTVGVLCSLVLIPLAGFAGRYGWQWPFLLHAVAFPLFFLALFGLGPDRPSLMSDRDAAAVAGLRAWPWRVLLITLAVGILMTGPLLYMPFHMRDIGIADPQLISGGLLATTLATALMAFNYGRIRTRLSLNAAFIAGFTLVMVGQFLCGLSANYVEVVGGLAIAGLGTGVLTTNVYAAAAIVATEANRARIMGLTKGALFSGPFVAQLILEPIVKATSAGTSLLVLSLFATVLMLMKIRQTFFTGGGVSLNSFGRNGA